MNPEPPLLIIAPLADGFDLAHLPWSEAARERISVNSVKFGELEMLEVIVDGMSFLLSRLSTAETGQRFAEERFEQLFYGLPSSGESAVAVAPRDNLTSARHLPEINHRMLLLGQWIGESLAATAAAWMPSRSLASFAYFDETVARYLAGSPFPALFQTSFSEVRPGCFETSGLYYFAGQEIRVTAPPDYSTSDVAERLIRIIDDIATHGRIDIPARSAGMVEGETLIFSPGNDPAHLDITIENHAASDSQAKM